MKSCRFIHLVSIFSVESVETGHYSDDFDDCSVSSDDDKDRQEYTCERRSSCDKDQELSLLEMSDHIHAAQQASASSETSFSDPIRHNDIPINGESPLGTQELGRLDGSYAEDFEDSESDESVQVDVICMCHCCLYCKYLICIIYY